MIVDTSALLAFLHAGEARHQAVVDLIGQAAEPLVVSPCVLAELDYLVASRVGVGAEVDVLRAMSGPAWEIARVTSEHLGRAADMVEKHADSRIGLTDALNVVLADAYRTRRVATLDRRHFGILRLADGSAIEIVP
jgi:predicted nucleic acid-binding protein